MGLGLFGSVDTSYIIFVTVSVRVHLAGPNTCLRAPFLAKYFITICMTSFFLQLDANLGVSTDNQTASPLPAYQPPLLVFLPWVLRACSLPTEYLSGRTVAVQLLCEMNIRHIRTQPTLEQLTLFYHLLQQAIQPTSVSIL